MSISGMAFLSSTLPSGKTPAPYCDLHRHPKPFRSDTVSIRPKLQSRNQLTIANAFKLSTHIPAPMEAEKVNSLSKRLQPFLNAAAIEYLEQHPADTQKILFRTSHQLVQAVKSLENDTRLPISLAVYQSPLTESTHTDEPQFIRIIDLPRPKVLQEARHPVSQAAYGIHLLRADLPRHLPPAFITKFLDPVWQFYAKKYDKALYNQDEEFQSLKQTVASWFGLSKPKSVPPLTFSEQEFEELMLAAHAIPLGLRVEDDASRSSYGQQLFDLLETFAQTLESQMESQNKSPKDLLSTRLGAICMNRQTGRLEYYDLSEILQSLAGIDSKSNPSPV